MLGSAARLTSGTSRCAPEGTPGAVCHDGRVKKMLLPPPLPAHARLLDLSAGREIQAGAADADDRAVGGFVLGLERSVRGVTSVVGIRSGIAAGHEHVDAGGGKTQELLVLRRDFALRPAQEGLAEAEADRELAEARLRRQVGDDAIERLVEIDEVERARGVDPDRRARRNPARPGGVQRLLAFGRRQRLAGDVHFLDLRQGDRQLVARPERRQIAVGGEGIDQDRDRLSLARDPEPVGVVGGQDAGDGVWRGRCGGRRRRNGDRGPDAHAGRLRGANGGGREAAAVLVHLAERLQPDDRVDAASDVGGEARRVGGGGERHTVLGHARHVDREALLDLIGARRGIDGGAVRVDVGDFEPLLLEPGDERFARAGVGGVDLLQLRLGDDLASRDAVLDVFLYRWWDFQRKQHCHQVVGGLGVRGMDHQPVAGQSATRRQRHDTVLENLAIHSASYPIGTLREDGRRPQTFRRKRGILPNAKSAWVVNTPNSSSSAAAMHGLPLKT